MQRITCQLILVLFLTCAAGCLSQRALITGEPVIHSVSPLSGAVTDRDVVNANQLDGIIPHDGEIISIVVNDVFLRHLAESRLTSPHVLVYAEVYDDGTDDPATAYSKVLFNAKDQPSGVHLGLADRMLYGPTAFKGYPIRIRFFIVEIDADDKKLASQLINAAGSIGQAASPEAAVAVGIAVQLAESINELNADDYELRFDLTLYPVNTIGSATLDIPSLENNQLITRDGMDVSSVMSLRAGPYAIFKRELIDRFNTRDTTPEEFISTIDVDHTVPMISTYPDGMGGQYVVTEHLRLQGGYVYRIVESIDHEPTEGSAYGLGDDQSIIVTESVHVDRKGPTTSQDMIVEREIYAGDRQLYKDQTYAVLTVLPGLQHGLTDQQMRASSDRDLAVLRSVLDNPDNLSVSDQLGPHIDGIVSSVKALIFQRRVASEAAKRAGRDPEWRLSVDYVMYWLKQIQAVPAKTDAKYANIVAMNAGVLATLNGGLITNLPLLEPSETKHMAALRALTRDDFEAVLPQSLVAIDSADGTKLAALVNKLQNLWPAGAGNGGVANALTVLKAGSPDANALQRIASLLQSAKDADGDGNVDGAAGVTEAEVTAALSKLRKVILPHVAGKGQFRLKPESLQTLENSAFN